MRPEHVQCNCGWFIMMMTIHCPACNVRLSVPVNAGGRAARCPKCKTKFRIPDPRSMLDETVTCWMDLDIDHEAEDEAVDARETLTANDVAAALGGPSESASADDTASSGTETATAAPPAAATESAPEEPTPETATETQPDPEAQGPAASEEAAPLSDEQAPSDSPPTPEPTDSVATPRTSVSLNVAADSDADDGAVETAYGSFVSTDAIRETAAVRDEGKTSCDMEGNLQEGRGARTLRVLGVGASGVRVAFDSQNLMDLYFRASMPMRCIISGKCRVCGTFLKDRLIARPLPWLDKASGKFTNAQELEQRYEYHLRDQRSPTEVVQTMHTLDELSAPFHNPMPYYVMEDQANKVSIHCETYSTPRGLCCEVVIPSGVYALEWFGRVNGVCNEQYHQLEQEVLKLEEAAWRSVPMAVRKRVSVWFDFKEGERFIAYFNDGDFSRSDAGLGGMVVTDKRLVFCKYHSKGSIPLDQPARIEATPDGSFCQIRQKDDSQVRRLIRLRLDDTRALAEVISQISEQVTMTIRQ